METMKIGVMSYDGYKARVQDIAAGRRKVAHDEPKIWFNSIESLSQVLSTRNLELLKLIAQEKPGSIKQLGILSGRTPSNLSRTLKTFQQYGVIEMRKTSGRAMMPVAKACRFSIDYAIQG